MSDSFKPDRVFVAVTARKDYLSSPTAPHTSTRGYVAIVGDLGESAIASFRPDRVFIGSKAPRDGSS